MSMLIIETNMQGVNKTKKYLIFLVKMKDLEKVSIILGIKIKKHSKGCAFVKSAILIKICPNLIIWE